MVRDKVRIRFRKTGDLRFTSHHDLMRCFERMLRRAGLPFHSTAGFNPKPRLVFAMPLPLGVNGTQEVVELELDAESPPDQVRDRLVRQAPPGLEILSVTRIDPKTTAHVRQACYRIAVPPERCGDLTGRIQELLARPECWVERSRPQRRRIDLRPYLSDVRLSQNMLEMDLWVTPNGTARPEEILRGLGLEELLENGAVFERTSLELEDESGSLALATHSPGSEGA